MTEIKEYLRPGPRPTAAPARPPHARATERLWLAAASLLVLLGAWQVFASKRAVLAEAEAGLASGAVVDLNAADADALGALLARSRRVTDRRDRALVLDRVAAFRLEGGAFGNVGGLMTSDLRVRVGRADSAGGPLYRRRARQARAGLGFSEALFRRETTAPPPLPPRSGEGDRSLGGTVRDADGEPVAGALVVLARVPPLSADSFLTVAVAVDTVEAGVRGRAVVGRDSAGARIPFTLTDTVRTDAAGRFAWHGLDAGGGYTLRVLKPGYDFGPAQGLASLDGWAARLPGARAFAFIGRPHRITLLDRATFDRLKAQFVARTPDDYRRGVLLALALFFGAFWLVHAGWTLRRFDGDPLLLPVLHLLGGLSLLLMLSLPDPLRDRDLAAGTAQGLAAGAVLMGLLAVWDVRRLHTLPVRLASRLRGHRASPRLLAFVQQGYPWLLLGALGLLVVLALGRGPEGSGVKVNLGFFQPSEAIKLLLLLFFAAYLAENGDFLRRLGRRRRWLYGLGLAGGVAGVMALYALQGDLGPALVLAVTLVTLWGIAQGRPGPVALGVAGIAAGFALGGAVVSRVGDRVAMFLSPWDNHAAGGGDHLAHALWSLATGGLLGQGLGEGAPATTPEAHTDMVLPSLGEELGLVGLVAVLLLYALLLHRGFLVALRSGHPFGFYLGTGIVVATGVQLVLIAGGALGVLPLTGVSVPLLSFGKASLLVHFVLFGAVMSLSARAAPAAEAAPVEREHRGAVAAAVLVFGALLGVLLLRLVWVQGIRGNDLLVRPALVAHASGLRDFVYNPRIELLRAEIPPGTIYDRRGIPLATSDPALIRRAATPLARLGVDAGAVVAQRARGRERLYPFGDLTFYLLGDLDTRAKWGSALLYNAEYEHLQTLRGFDNRPEDVAVEATLRRRFDPRGARDTAYAARRFDFDALRPLLRAGLDSRAAERFRRRNRDVVLTVDVALQRRFAGVIAAQARAEEALRGKVISAVALDARTGELLATVTYPLPEATARPDSVAADPQAFDHGLYVRRAPGSTLKVATAVAAFRRLGPQAARWTTVVDASDPDHFREGEPVGRVDMRQAIVRSSNAYFRRIAAEGDLLGDLLAVYDRVGIAVGRPGMTEDERREALAPDYQLRYAAMGQGLVAAAPVDLAGLAGAVAQGGMHAPLRTVRSVGGAAEPQEEPARLMGAREAGILTQYMAAVVGNAQFPLPALGVAGKTGTAERARGRQRLPNDAWYVGFAPTRDGRSHVVVCVLVEEGEASAHAARVAYHLFQTLHASGYTTPGRAAPASPPTARPAPPAAPAVRRPTPAP